MKHPSVQTIKSAKRRINILQGQLGGLQKMIESNSYCVDILNQSLAIQNSLRSLDMLILEGHLKTHVKDNFSKDTEEAVEELMTLYKRIAK